MLDNHRAQEPRTRHANLQSDSAGNGTSGSPPVGLTAGPITLPSGSSTYATDSGSVPAGTTSRHATPSATRRCRFRSKTATTLLWLSFSSAFFDGKDDGSFGVQGRWSDWTFPPGSLGESTGELDGLVVPTRQAQTNRTVSRGGGRNRGCSSARHRLRLRGTDPPASLLGGCRDHRCSSRRKSPCSVRSCRSTGTARVCRRECRGTQPLMPRPWARLE